MSHANNLPLSRAAYLGADSRVEWAPRGAPAVIYASAQHRWVIQAERGRHPEQSSLGLARTEALAEAGLCAADLDAKALARSLVAALAEDLSLRQLRAIHEAFGQELAAEEARRPARLHAFTGSSGHSD